ncbi:MAG TPA: NAD(P)/FAD-dependent oxidoreductase [Candidatus Limnocylindrales bacterium]|jgi:NADH dehydrogenase
MTEGRAAHHRVVIVGGGFGGLYAAKGLGRDPRVDLTVVDRRNFHLFQPLMYQVATGALSPGDIAQPLRAILRRNRNTTVLLGEAIAIDADARRVVLSDGGPIEYDTLIVATGASHTYFGHDEWSRFAPGLKTVEDAIDVRRRILIAFEAAEREADPVRRAEWMSFVVVGGGPTGAELAGALGEIARDTLRRDFRSIDPAEARIILVEAMERILPTFVEQLADHARRDLERLGVTVRTRTRVTDIDAQGVTVATGEGARAPTERIPARTVIWAAGVRPSTFGRLVAEATGARTDRTGRIVVEPDLSIAGRPEILVIGDLAASRREDGTFVPAVAQGGIQGGRHAAAVVRARLDGRPPPAFRYHHKGDLAVIGRAKAIADLGPYRRFSGYLAWWLWLLIHVAYLIGFQNRIVVLVRWAWSYWTRGRNTRLITEGELLPPIQQPEPPAQAPER